MKRISVALALLATMALAASLPAVAAKKPNARAHDAHACVGQSIVCPASDVSACGSSCPRSASAATAAATTHSSSGGLSCPVADPSACPAGCSRTGSGVMAVRTAKH